MAPETGLSLRTLDVGCGNAKTPGSIGIDGNSATQADVIHDLDSYPWPLESSSFDKIVCSHIVEHVADMVKFLAEVHRISVPGGLIEIVTPHFSNRFSYTDPTHVRHLSLRSFDYFATKRVIRQTLFSRALETQFAVPDFYVSPLFTIVYAHLRLARPFRYLGLQWIANRFPDFYELYLTWTVPARDLYFTLKTVK